VFKEAFMKVGSSIRPLAENCRCVVVAQVPAPGTRTGLRWPDGAAATLAREDAAVTVCYCWREGETWHTQRQTIGLMFDTPHFGGVRTFWECLLCKGRARKLYLPPDGERFACKRCLRLAYRSQRLRPWPRALRRAAKIRRYLGCDGSAADPLPPRPAAMRRKTYQALCAEAQALEAVPLQAWVCGGRGAALGVRRGTVGAKKRQWWPSRNGWGKPGSASR
jgi:hypothetical protein